jgi:rare lipoprotein A (peptidoglycan hydrolase)
MNAGSRVAVRSLALALLGGMLGLSGCSSTPTTRDAVPRAEAYSKYGNPASYEVLGQRYEVMKDNRGYRETGIASWYGPGFHGKRASAGEEYDMYAMTAAHKTLRIPCYVEVTNLQNGKRAVVRVNDRGPFHDNRIIDLSFAAAQKLGVVGTGTALVEVRHLDVDQAPPPQENAPSSWPRQCRSGGVTCSSRSGRSPMRPTPSACASVSPPPASTRSTWPAAPTVCTACGSVRWVRWSKPTNSRVSWMRWG